MSAPLIKHNKRAQPKNTRVDFLSAHAPQIVAGSLAAIVLTFPVVAEELAGHHKAIDNPLDKKPANEFQALFGNDNSLSTVFLTEETDPTGGTLYHYNGGSVENKVNLTQMTKSIAESGKKIGTSILKAALSVGTKSFALIDKASELVIPHAEAAVVCYDCCAHGYIGNGVAMYGNPCDIKGYVEDYASLGYGVKTGVGSYVGKNAQIDDYVTICDGATIGKMAYIHSCAVIGPDAYIGAYQTVPEGCYVTKKCNPFSRDLTLFNEPSPQDNFCNCAPVKPAAKCCAVYTTCTGCYAYS